MLKTIYWKHYLKRGKGIFAFPPPSHVALDTRRDAKKSGRFQKGLAPRNLPVVPWQGEWGSWSKQSSVSQRGQQCGCGSPHTAWLSWGRKARWEKRLQRRWKKGITGSEETAVYQIAFQRASVKILILKKFRGSVRACSCWPGESRPRPPAHRNMNKTRQSEKNTLRRIW